MNMFRRISFPLLSFVVIIRSRYIYDQVIREIDLLVGSAVKVLEVGYGNGLFANYLLARRRIQYAGVEIIPKRVLRPRFLATRIGTIDFF